MAFIFLFLSIFLSFPILYVNIKNFYVGVFSGAFKARMLKLGLHMDNEFLYCGIANRTPCSYSSLHLSTFLSFKAKFVSQFSPELCKLDSSNVIYITGWERTGQMLCIVDTSLSVLMTLRMCVREL